MKVTVRQFKDLAEGQRFMFLEATAKYFINNETVREFQKAGPFIYKSPDLAHHYFIGDDKLLVGIKIEDSK